MDDPNRLSAAHDRPPWDGPSRTIVLATTPRTASTMLALGLAAAGVGMPSEYLNPLTRGPLSRRWETSRLDDYLTMARRHRTVGGAFVVKTHFNHFEPLWRNGRLDQLLDGAAWVSLSRVDRIKQAVSLHLARSTGRWWPGGRRRFARYSSPAIRKRLEEIDRQELGWIQVFSALGVEPMRVFTEDLVAEPIPTMRAVLDGLGFEGVPAVMTSPSGDDRVPRWAARFRRAEEREQ